MKSQSPFTLNRFEMEQKHLYFLPQPLFDSLQGRRCVYLVGSRGTGKTTLLQALNWREQLENPQLRQQLDADLSARRYIGIYVKMPEYQLSAFDSWLPRYGETLSAALLGLYLDLICLEEVAEAVACLILKRVFKAAPVHEYECVRQILARSPELCGKAGVPEKCSLKRLASILRGKRMRLGKLATSDADVQKEVLASEFPTAQVGDLGRHAAAAVGQFCNQFAAQERGDGWHFKLCFDEAESLTEFQQRVLNTAVRLTRSPISYVVAYVRPVDEMTATLLPSLTLQRADRDVVLLENMDDRQFAGFAEGVSNVRIQHLLQTPECRFATERTLGSLDINALLHGRLVPSESKSAAALLEKAHELRQNLDALNADSRESPYPPIYQAYIIDRLGLGFPSKDTPKERRKQDSAEIRKRMVAAYLCICSEFNFQPRYAYSEMVLQMSDKCIRDYLAQMNEVLIQADLDLASFCDRAVPVDVQDVAFHRASVQKREVIPARVSSPVETARIVDGLAQLTAILQTVPTEQDRVHYRPLRSSERGVFVLQIGGTIEAVPEILRWIAEAAEAGFLKMVSQTSDEWHFRVHCSLAAAYGFSYRGAYYSVRVAPAELVSLCYEPDAARRLEIIQRLARLLGGTGDALPLFEGLF